MDNQKRITLNIVQHNVLNWQTQKVNLLNTYQTIDPDIILINSHGLNINSELKIFNYNVHKRNNSGERNDGVAIAIKKNIKYKLLDDFTQEILAIKTETTLGEIVIGTAYLPPRRNICPYDDIMKLLNYNNPVYILGDFNARHRVFGNNNCNQIGNALNNIIQTGKLIHHGPDFGTFLTHQNTTTPDKIFTNNKAFLNTYARPGPLTGSDHLPIIYTISTSPIQIEIPERLKMCTADWISYRTDLEEHEIPQLENKTLEDIDDALRKLLSAITAAVDKNIPKTKYRTLPHNIMDEEIRRLQALFNNLKQYLERFGPNQRIMRNIRNVQDEIKNKCLVINRRVWEEIMQKLDEEKDAKHF